MLGGAYALNVSYPTARVSEVSSKGRAVARVLCHERAPEQVRDARDEKNDDDLPKADLIESAADRDAGHERDEHRNTRDDAERHKIRCEEAQSTVGDELHRRRKLEHRRKGDHVLAR